MKNKSYRISYANGNTDVGHSFDTDPLSYKNYEEAEKSLLNRGYIKVGKVYFGKPGSITDAIKNPKAYIDEV